MRKVQLVVLSLAILFSFFPVLKIYETPLSLQYITTESKLMSPIKTSNPLFIHDNNEFVFVFSFLSQNSQYFSSAMWASFFLTLFVFKGSTKRVWHQNGFDYDIFRMLLRKRGGLSKLKIMELLSLPKNKQQMAKLLSMNWRSVDNHVNMLLKNNLIYEIALVGTSKYYMLTGRGISILSLIAQLRGQSDSYLDKLFESI